MAVMLHNEAVAEVIVISEYVHDNGLILEHKNRMIILDTLYRPHI